MRTYTSRNLTLSVPTFKVHRPIALGFGNLVANLNDRKLGLTRLKIALEHFKKLPSSQVNMQSWMENTECGTVACFVGHACTIKSLNDAGLTISPLLRNLDSVPAVFGSTGVPAVKEFFKITDSEFMYLFHETSYPRATKYYVSRRVESALKKLEQNIKKVENENI